MANDEYTKQVILVLDADRGNGENLCRLIEALGLEATHIISMEELKQYDSESFFAGMLINLDTITTGRQFFSRLKKERPRLVIFGLSKRSWHPELSEALGSTISACLRHPVDIGELHFCLKGLLGNTKEINKSSPNESFPKLNAVKEGS